jgi:hypothetical protein
VYDTGGDMYAKKPAIHQLATRPGREMQKALPRQKRHALIYPSMPSSPVPRKRALRSACPGRPPLHPQPIDAHRPITLTFQHSKTSQHPTLFTTAHLALHCLYVPGFTDQLMDS